MSHNGKRQRLTSQIVEELERHAEILDEDERLRAEAQAGHPGEEIQIIRVPPDTDHPIVLIGRVHRSRQKRYADLTQGTGGKR